MFCFQGIRFTSGQSAQHSTNDPTEMSFSRPVGRMALANVEKSNRIGRLKPREQREQCCVLNFLLLRVHFHRAADGPQKPQEVPDFSQVSGLLNRTSWGPILGCSILSFFLSSTECSFHFSCSRLGLHDILQLVSGQLVAGPGQPWSRLQVSIKK